MVICGWVIISNGNGRKVTHFEKSQARRKFRLSLQVFCARVIAEVLPRVHTRPAFSKLNIFTIEEIRTIQTGLFIFHYAHDFLPVTFKGYFQLGYDIHSYSTRSCSSHRHIYTLILILVSIGVATS